MVVELVQMLAKPGSEAAFEAAFSQAIEILKRSKGCEGVRLLRGIENPNRYRILITWQTLEDHTVGFRGSPDQTAFRELLGPHVDREGSIPVEHHSIVMQVSSSVDVH